MIGKRGGVEEKERRGGIRRETERGKRIGGDRGIGGIGEK